MKNKKGVILSVGIAGIVLLSTVMLFVIKNGSDAEPDGRMENMQQSGLMDDDNIDVNYSSVFK